MKAQISLFIIIGIIVLITVGIIIFALFRDVDVKAKASKNVFLSATNFLRSCFEKSSFDGLKILGQQAGVLFVSQNGLTPDNTIKIVSLNDKNYVYLVDLDPKTVYKINGEDFFTTDFSRPKLYPWKKFPLHPTTDEKTYFLSSGFGWNKMIALAPKEKIEKQLESFIDNRFKSCLTGSSKGISIDNKADVKVVFGDVFTILLDGFIDLKAGDSSNRVSGKNFVVKQRVNLEKLYNFARHIVENEINDIKFNPSSAGELSVKTEKTTDGSTIFHVSDSSIPVSDRFIFSFAIPNRAPALEFVEEQIAGIDCSDKNIFVKDSQLFVCNANPISLLSHDPDGDSIVYSLYLNNAHVNLIDKDTIQQYKEKNINIKFDIKSCDSYGLCDSQTITVQQT